MGGKGILLMILGPIGVRVTYELLMMAVLAVKNIISINNKLSNQNGDAAAPDIFSPDMSNLKDAFGKKEPVPAAPAAPAVPVAPAAPVEQVAPTDAVHPQKTEQKQDPEQ